MNNIFIGGAFPYANGSLHLGHISSLLPGDILARYYRLKGKNVLYVAGSDCHGTPISIRSEQEGISPKEITNKYHNEFLNCFNQLGFSYDLYTRTDNEFHHQIVKEIFLELRNKDYIYQKETQQTYCNHCNQFLPDRYVEGDCPHCSQHSRGDQCEFCSKILDPVDLLNKKCKLCNNSPVEKSTTHFYFALSKFQTNVQKFLDSREGWRDNAISFTRRFLKEGLHDRAATRDLQWGIEVPIEGFQDKKIYVWIEAVLGYLSASKEWASKNNKEWKPFWGDDCISYYVHGKDNIPFHSIILTSLLSGIENLRLPDKIISNEYLTLENKKISTSRNWAVWVPYILEHYHPDSIRYFLTINAPEKKDANFSWREFIYSHNSELLGHFGNFINRTLSFIQKSYNGVIESTIIDDWVEDEITKLYSSVANCIENGHIKQGLEDIFEFIRKSNKYFDEQKPWLQIKENRKDCTNTLYNCVQIIANLSVLLQPYIPFTCEKIQNFLSINIKNWQYIVIEDQTNIKNLSILFERIDINKIEQELAKLEQSHL